MISQGSRKIKALAYIHNEHKILMPLENIEDLTIEYVSAENELQFKAPYPDIMLVVSDWRYNVAKAVLRAKELNIPTLMFQDGTLDFILQYSGDLYSGQGGAAHYHPVLTDKIACIGYQSARSIASWSGMNKVEVTGFPKMHEGILDAMKFRKSNSKSSSSGKKIILVTSTRQGWFNEKHKNAFIEALSDLKEYLNKRDDIQVIWRLSRDLHQIIGVKNKLEKKESYELVELLKQSDAVISAQSTVVVEAMLYGKPVAIIDYLNSPQYYSPAWLISAKSHLPTVINELIEAPTPKLLFQEEQLSDILFINGDPIERSWQLIKKMVDGAVEEVNILGFCSPFPDKIALPDSKVFPTISYYKKSKLWKLRWLNSRLKGELNLMKRSNRIFNFLRRKL